MVLILNPWDSQGNQIADSTGIYPTVRGCGGGGYQQGYVLQRKVKDELSGNNGSADESFSEYVRWARCQQRYACDGEEICE